MTVKRVYHYRITCDVRKSPDCQPVVDALGTDQIDAVYAAGWGFRGMAGEVSESWCDECGRVRDGG